MIIFLSLLLVVAAVAMVVKKNRPGAVICAALLITLAVIRPFMTPTPSDRLAKFDNQNKSVMTQVLAEQVVERHAGKRIALVVGPELEGMPEERKRRHSIEGALTEAFQELGVDPLIVPLPLMEGFRKKLAQAKASGGEVGFSPEMAYYTTLMEVLVQYSARDINALLVSLKEKTDVVVWTLDLSSRIKADKLLARGKGPELILMKVNVDDLERAFKSTVLDMHLKYRPNASWEIDYEWPKNVEEAFNSRYVIATRENPSLSAEE